jgi:hypothetical protein
MFIPVLVTAEPVVSDRPVTPYRRLFLEDTVRGRVEVDETTWTLQISLRVPASLSEQAALLFGRQWVRAALYTTGLRAWTVVEAVFPGDAAGSSQEAPFRAAPRSREEPLRATERCSPDPPRPTSGRG